MNKVPQAPEILNEVGEHYWEIYCKVFIQRGNLEEHFLGSIESLCNWEQQRVEVQNEIEEEGLFNEFKTESGDTIRQSRGLDKTLQRISSQIRYLKSDLKLNPEAVKQSKKSNLKLVSKDF